MSSPFTHLTGNQGLLTWGVGVYNVQLAWGGITTLKHCIVETVHSALTQTLLVCLCH